MPFSGSTYTLPAGYIATNGQVSDAPTQHNAPLEDIQAALTIAKTESNGALPKAGGTMTGPLTLSGDATDPLEAVPLRQVQALGGYATRAAAIAATIPAPAIVIYVRGHTTEGVGGAWYKEVTDTGTLEAWQFRSNSDTRRWQLVFDREIQASQLGLVYGDASGANAATNDAVISAYRAMPFAAVLTFTAGIIEVSQTLRPGGDGKGFRGARANKVFSAPSSTYGTITRWHGPSGGVVFDITSEGTVDIYSPVLEDISVDGNALAGEAYRWRAVQRPIGRNLDCGNMRATGSPVGYNFAGGKTGGTEVNCVYRGLFENLNARMDGGGFGYVLSGAAGEGNTTFCRFAGLHGTHKNNALMYVNSADDNIIEGLAGSRLAGGAGFTLQIDGSGATWVVGNIWNLLQTGTTDGTSGVYCNGSKARQNRVENLTGVDDAPTVIISGGSQLYYSYLGGGYAGTDASEGAVSRVPPMQIVNNPIADKTTLDWYEEDPTATVNLGHGASFVTTGFTQTTTFKITRIGNIGVVSGKCTLTANGATPTTDAVALVGFPFIFAGGQNYPVSISAITGFTSGIIDRPLTAKAVGGTTRIDLYKTLAGAGGQSLLTVADIGATATFEFSGTVVF